MAEGASRIEQKQALLRKRAKRGDLEFALCAVMIVFSIGFPFTILIVFLMHRGSELWRIIGSIQAGVLMALTLGILVGVDLGGGGFAFFLTLCVLYAAAALTLSMSPNIQAFQAMQRERFNPTRRRRRTRRPRRIDGA